MCILINRVSQVNTYKDAHSNTHKHTHEPTRTAIMNVLDDVKAAIHI